MKVDYKMTYKFNKKTRVCDDCGKRYKPNAPNQRYCQICRLWRSKQNRIKGVRNG